MPQQQPTLCPRVTQQPSRVCLPQCGRYGLSDITIFYRARRCLGARQLFDRAQLNTAKWLTKPLQQSLLPVASDGPGGNRSPLQGVGYLRQKLSDDAQFRFPGGKACISTQMHTCEPAILKMGPGDGSSVPRVRPSVHRFGAIVSLQTHEARHLSEPRTRENSSQPKPCLNP